MPGEADTVNVHDDAPWTHQSCPLPNRFGGEQGVRQRHGCGEVVAPDWDTTVLQAGYQKVKSGSLGSRGQGCTHCGTAVALCPDVPDTSLDSATHIVRKIHGDVGTVWAWA